MPVKQRRSRFHAWCSLAASALMLLATVPLGSIPAAAASADIVITQVYGGGGNSGATYKNDFIELFNRGTAPVDVTGWSVQYGSATGTTWGTSNITPLSGVIQPGHYYLIQEAAGTGTASPLPVAPDATGTVNLAAGAGKVALARSAAPLSGACPTGAVDLVGYGSTNCAEGAAAPTLDNSSADIRSDSCVDTDSNVADFRKLTPAPRNSASAGSVCGAPTNPTGSGAAAPATVTAGAPALLTVAVTPGQNPLSTGISVTADLTALGGAAAQPLFNDGTNGDTAAGDATFSFQTTVPLDNAPGDYALPVTITDAQGRTAATAIALTVQPAVVTPPAPLLISELLIDPATSNEPEEYIKVYNPTAAPVDISGWSVVTLTGATNITTARAAFPAGAVVGAHQSVVATKNGAMYRQQVDPHATAAVTFEYGATPSGFGTGMVLKTTAVPALSNTSAVVILRDAYGTEVDVVPYLGTGTTATPYTGAGWSGPVIQFPQTKGFGTTNRILARAIDESTITATAAGTYKADTNTAADWLSAGTDSRGGWTYWQNPASPGPTPFSTRDYVAGQMQSLPLPTWNFDGSVTGFMGPDNSFETLRALFDSATSTIDINIYEFTLVDLAQALVNAHQRGVAVRVLIEGEPCCDSAIGDQNRYVAKLLNDAGVQVRFLQRDAGDAISRRYQNVDHAKYAVVDNGTAGAQLMVFSGNFKNTSASVDHTSGNRDWGVIVRNSDAAQYFEQIFTYDYDPLQRDSLPYGYVCKDGSCNLGAPAVGFTPDLSHGTDPGATYAHPFSARTVTGAFAVTPVLVPETDLLSSKAILGMVKNARTSIALEYATLNKYWGSGISTASETTTPVPLVEELLNAARRGVAVRVLLDGKYDAGGPKDNDATVAYLNQKSQAEGLNLQARIMPYTVISGCPDKCPTYLAREFPGFNEIHNKGIIVDGRQTLISSINGTQASWTQNREAALIVENAELAAYFGDAFWYDWYDGKTAPEWPVISEVQYSPAGADAQNAWFEVYNPTTADINLTGWTMQNKSGGSWAFPAGTVLPAGKTLTVAASRDGFWSLFGFDPDLAGETLQLVNTGDLLRLVKPDATTADQVAWSNFLPDWGAGAPTGQSLVRTNACKDTNSVIDWAAGTPQPGTATCNGTTPPPPAPPAPTASITLTPATPDGTEGWYRSDVTVTAATQAWGATQLELSADGGATWVTVAERAATAPFPALTLTGTQTVQADTAGATYLARVTDVLGRQAVSSAITFKRDGTVPIITYTGNAGTYTVDQTVAITCAAADSLSGVAATTCADVTGPASSFGLGTHTVSATAVDRAGNTADASVSFTVAVSEESLCALTRQAATKDAVADSLCAKLNAARAAGARGDAKARAGSIDAYIHEVEAQSGKALTAEWAATLIRFAESL